MLCIKLLQCLESLCQVFDDIIDMLGTDGKTNGVGTDTLIEEFFLIALGMSCRCGVDSQ